MKNIKKIVKYIIGYDTEYTKKEMSLFTRAILILLLFIIPMFFVLLFVNMKFGASYNLCKMFFTTYSKICTISISAYSVAWLGQMGKAYLAKRNEEEIKREKDLIVKLKKEISKLKGE